jgi:hypothetical protein
MKWRVILEFDSDNHGWAVWCPELPGHTSAGDSSDRSFTKYSSRDRAVSGTRDRDNPPDFATIARAENS